jgi:deazaflavin-dependent oxidoreductase (nitroreductase family)
MRSQTLGYRLIQVGPRLIYRLGLGGLIGHTVLLLITTGRRTGLQRTTPLQYEEIDGAFYLGSARGTSADWYRNIVANPRVLLQVGRRTVAGYAEAVTDPVRIADFLAVRLDRHPRMVGAMLRAEGLTVPPSRAELERYVSRMAIVIVTPEPPDGEQAASHP